MTFVWHYSVALRMLICQWQRKTSLRHYRGRCHNGCRRASHRCSGLIEQTSLRGVFGTFVGMKNSLLDHDWLKSLPSTSPKGAGTGGRTGSRSIVV